MDEGDVSQLKIQAIEYLCEDLTPTNLMELEDHADVPCFSRGDEEKEGHADFRNLRQRLGVLVSTKQYDLSVVP